MRGAEAALAGRRRPAARIGPLHPRPGARRRRRRRRRSISQPWPGEPERALALRSAQLRAARAGRALDRLITGMSLADRRRLARCGYRSGRSPRRPSAEQHQPADDDADHPQRRQLVAGPCRRRGAMRARKNRIVDDPQARASQPAGQLEQRQQDQEERRIFGKLACARIRAQQGLVAAVADAGSSGCGARAMTRRLSQMWSRAAAPAMVSVIGRIMA